MMERGTSPEGRGFCEHGNNPSTCKACNVNTVKGITRKDLSGYIQAGRGKKNIRYERSGEAAIAKYVTLKKEGPNNINRLAHEAALLQKLQSTGITPRVIDFKRYQSTEQPKARLLLEELPGTSLDHMRPEEQQVFVQEHAQKIVEKTAATLARIAHEGIHVVDINEGTFLFKEKNDDIEVYVVDFELGYDETEGIGDALISAEVFLGQRDPAYSMHEKEMPRDVDTLTRAELYRWASMLQHLFVPHIPTEISFKIEEQAAFHDYMNHIRPLVHNRALAKVRRAFAEMREYGSDDFAEIIGTGEDTYIESHLPYEISLEVREAQLPFTLPEALAQSNIKLDERTIDFLSRCLSYIPSQRPRNFAELGNTSG